MKLKSFYQDQFTNQIFYFWQKAFDDVNGGVYTCFNNEGSQLVSHDKYVWSQGRYLWVVSKMVQLAEKQLINNDIKMLKKQANLTANFLHDNALLPDGSSAFLLTEDGEKKETTPGVGYDDSIFADCFVLLGFAKYLEVIEHRDDWAQWLWQLYQNVEKRINNRTFKTDPYPVPEGMISHSIPMIMQNVNQEMASCFAKYDAKKAAYCCEQTTRNMTEILTVFCDDQNRIGEILNEDQSRQNTVLQRHLNPGHSIEDSWFIVETALMNHDQEALAQAKQIVLKALELGWDHENGGILRYVDYEDGGQPQGQSETDGFTQLINETWDYKLWWPHAETLYTLLLLMTHFKDLKLKDWYQKVHEYVFRTFTNTDQNIREWIQIRTRDGQPVSKVVALPVKDPYHIMRSMLLIIELMNKVNFDLPTVK
ncbi:AGE family epimerase/isomerase [Paucilactobacillus sp. N302-9]